VQAVARTVWKGPKGPIFGLAWPDFEKLNGRLPGAPALPESKMDTWSGKAAGRDVQGGRPWSSSAAKQIFRRARGDGPSEPR
jgi:hypothetical protein